MMRCARFARCLDDTVAGRVAPETERWMAAHAAACTRCRAEEAAARPSANPTPTVLGDLPYLNQDPMIAYQHWAPISSNEMAQVEAQLRGAVRRGDDFVSVPFPRLAVAGPSGNRQAVQAMEAYRREAAVVDARLFRKVTLAFKGTALSDLCDRLRADTGIGLTAGRSVADEKVTAFCAVFVVNVSRLPGR